MSNCHLSPWWNIRDYVVVLWNQGALEEARIADCHAGESPFHFSDTFFFDLSSRLGGFSPKKRHRVT